MMGLQDTESGAGWFNGSNYAVLADNDYDYDAAEKESWDYIRNRIKEFREDKAAAVDFFKRKMLSQWNAPDYHVLFSTSSFTCEVEEMPEIVYNVYVGDAKTVLEAFMNRYQFVLYAGVMLWLIGFFVRKKPLQDDLLIIAIIGGFLFSLIWEAKSRYVLLYMVFSVPLAASGFCWLQELAFGLFVKKKTDKIVLTLVKGIEEET